MSARELLQLMVRTDRGSMTVWSPQEVSQALDAYRAEVLNEASAELEKDYRLWQTEPRWREGKGDSRGPGVGHAMTRLERMADQADPRCPVCKGDGGDPEDPGDWCPEVGMHNPTTRAPCPECHGSGFKATA